MAIILIRGLDVLMIMNTLGIRTHYFMQAAAILGESVTALTHPQALDASLTSGIVKIDPPVHNETNIRKINAIGLDYIHFLQNMAARPGIT